MSSRSIRKPLQWLAVLAIVVLTIGKADAERRCARLLGPSGAENVSARAAVSPFPGASGYVTAKAAVRAFAEAVAVEYRQRGVRCNTVLPSVIDTPANRAAQPDADHGRWVPPAEIAEMIRFLASPESAPTSGASIPVYGRA